MKIKDLLSYSKGELIGNINLEQDIQSFTIDSREKISKCFFIPLSSKKEERAQHIENAFENGAIGAFSEKEIEVPEGKFLIKVQDNLLAMQETARNFRKSISNIPLIAITGSVGKTTTKDMVYAVLNTTYRTLKSEGNFNNEIGMPYTLLNYQNQEMIVLEMGMSQFGEISLLTDIAKPNVALIVNIGTSHIGNLGSRENILKAKMEIMEGMDENGIIVLNNDNDLLRTVDNTKPKKMTVGIQNDSDIMAYDIKVHENNTTFFINEDGKEYEFKIMLSSEKYVYNAMLAICVGRIYQIPMEKIQKALENCEFTKMRMNIERVNDITIIDDCYNASLESIKVALDALRSQNGKRKIAILGDVLELGAYSESLHQSIGEAVADANVDMLVTIGDYSQNVKQGAIKGGMNEEKILVLSKTEDILERIQDIIQKEDDVLIKASRGMHFESIVNRMQNNS